MFYAVSFEPTQLPLSAGGQPSWPYYSLYIGDQNRKLIIPVNRWPAIFSNASSVTVTPPSPVVYLQGAAGGQTITLSTAGTPASPVPLGAYPWYFYQRQNTPAGGTPLTNQVYILINASTSACTVQSDSGTVNGSSTYSMGSGSTGSGGINVVFCQFDQNSPGNWTLLVMNQTLPSNFYFGP